jgi:hypothetical protein
MNDAELDALELYLLQHGTVGPQAAYAITTLRQERDAARAENERLRALLLTIHDALVPPSWVRDRITAALRREET